MEPDHRYECALNAALAICEFFNDATAKPRHELLATTLFSILDAFKRYEEVKQTRHDGFSIN